MQFTAKQLAPQIQAIGRAATRMNRRDHQVWQSRLHYVYGDMQGQRGVDFSSFAGNLDRHSTIIALESLYYLVSVLISTSALYQDPSAHLSGASRLSKRALERFLCKVFSGSVYDELGILGCSQVYPLDWLTDADHDLRDSLRNLIRSLGNCWDGTTLSIPGDDPLQSVHRELFPSNLTHITGQFYSPEWLAELLIADVGWKPEQTLIDPFCGSGVFLIKALRSALSDGHCPTEVLSQIVGIDINPFAAAATRANLTLFIARSGVARVAPIHLNVLCADAIFPSIAKGKKFASQRSCGASLSIDHGAVPPCDFADPVTTDNVFKSARAYGLDLRRWQETDKGALQADMSQSPLQPRSVVEQQLTCCLQKADVVATNPPWVGWEYLSRPYRDSIHAAWTAHDLFQSKGLEAAFLKEDLSNLALLAAWDAYLREGGRSVVVLRPSTMHSEVASRGVRRLSLAQGGIDLKLEQIRTFDSIRLFKSASAGAATWMIRKGEKTQFPVPVAELQKLQPRWNPDPTDSASDVARQTRIVDKVALPTDPANAMSRWMITSAAGMQSMRRLHGANPYTPRMGVFTGGANGVFYLERSPGTQRFRNMTARCKRQVPQVEVDLDQQLIHSIARGRDIAMWQCRPNVFLLLPHSATSQMYPIVHQELEAGYPKTYRYLCAMKETLQARNGFANWEKRIHRQYFYTLQRIGAYTFAPFKVCWRYIASEFTICVLESDADGKVILPNDKVMFIPLDNPDEAYFVAGYLSSQLVRSYVSSIIEKRQISTRVIKSLAIPTYDPSCQSHQIIRDCCRHGHAMLRSQPEAKVDHLKAKISRLVERMYEKL